MSGLFAHAADLHLGAMKDRVLREQERESLRRLIDTAIERDYDFILLSGGDIFHVPVPDMETATFATQQFMRFRETGKMIYAIYGSHDYSPPTDAALIEVLEAAGVLRRVGEAGEVPGDVQALHRQGQGRPPDNWGVCKEECT
ncbi:metallophosphoesterase [Thermogymnomonas acidicola]|uniref:metallophosphoesterase n=1 Tax=Thermogymnomonas acidicola TaxID=399579 RepID=UPI000946816F|nr:metallophosphoesterase [Thermogymnomonas acidicola]